MGTMNIILYLVSLFPPCGSNPTEETDGATTNPNFDEKGKERQ